MLKYAVRPARHSIAAVLSVGFVIAVLQGPTAQAAETLQFVISAADGYGIEDCMKPGQACGQVIADAWCESHGHGHASAFGSSDDVTGSTKVSASNTSPVLDHAIVIKCGE